MKRVALSVLLLLSAGCGGNAPSPPEPIAHYEDALLSFDAPASWRLQDRPGVMGTMGGPLLIFANYLPAAPFCTAGSGCEGARLGAMPAGGVMVIFGTRVALGQPAEGSATTVGGRTATVTRADTTCTGMSADLGVRVSVRRDVPGNMFTFDGCFRAPGVARHEGQLRAMLSTAAFKVM